VALDNGISKPLYLVEALASSRHACVQAMANKIVQRGTPTAKVVETVCITTMDQPGDLIAYRKSATYAVMPKGL